MKALKIHYINS